MTQIGKPNGRSLLTRIFAAGLALLGFGCSSCEEENVMCMYGTPMGSFEIKGRVTSEDGTAVQNATIKVTAPDIPSGLYYEGNATTGQNGDYMAGGHTARNKVKVVCLPDGTDLQADSTLVDLDFVRDKKDKNMWNIGTAEATADFVLKKKAEK